MRDDLAPGRLDRARVDPAERVEQRAMALGIEQAAIVVLAVDLDRQRAEVAQQSGGHRAAADEGAAAAVALERPADDQRLARLDLDALFARAAVDRDGRAAGRSRPRPPPVLARRDQAGIGARAEREPKRVEQDRFARAGFAGEHAKARLELELELLDQHDIVDGELPQHARSARLARFARAPSITRRRARSAGSCWPSRLWRRPCSGREPGWAQRPLPVALLDQQPQRLPVPIGPG